MLLLSFVFALLLREGLTLPGCEHRSREQVDSPGGLVATRPVPSSRPFCETFCLEHEAHVASPFEILSMNLIMLSLDIAFYF